MARKLCWSFGIIIASILISACGGKPNEEIQQAIQQRLRYYGEIRVTSVEKASNPEYYPSGFDAPPEEVWCVVIDTSNIPVDPIGLGPNPTHFAVMKKGLQYSTLLVGDSMLQSLFPQMGCRNF